MVDLILMHHVFCHDLHKQFIVIITRLMFILINYGLIE